jgi:hypothetical protein
MWSGWPAVQTTVQTLEAMQARVEILVEWNQECGATSRNSTNGPEPMTACWIIDQDVLAIPSYDVHEEWGQAVEVDRITGVEFAWRRGDDHRGRRMLRAP